MDTIQKMPLLIIQEQELVIGPLAWDEAKKVSGLVVDPESGSVSLSGDKKEIINNLVARYERIFGEASHIVCRNAVEDLVVQMNREDVPESLRL